MGENSAELLQKEATDLVTPACEVHPGDCSLKGVGEQAGKKGFPAAGITV
jgi:hypothetical protein